MATRKAKTAGRKPAKKARARKRAAPDYSAMSLEELAIESGMPPGRVKESLASLLMLNELDAARRSGLSFRLPTAEEWEYACRAGSKGDYCLRDDGVEITAENLDTVSWGDGDEGCSEDDLQPVGRKRANAFGLHDMLGLVGEWTASNDGDDGIYCGLQAKASSRERQQTFENSIEYWFSAMDCLGFRLCADRRAD